MTVELILEGKSESEPGEYLRREYSRSGFSYFNVHMNPLGFILKCRFLGSIPRGFWFRKPGLGPEILNVEQTPSEVDVVGQDHAFEQHNLTYLLPFTYTILHCVFSSSWNDPVKIIQIMLLLFKMFQWFPIHQSRS